MKSRSFLFIAVLALAIPLSGCFGIPEDAIHTGDVVTADVTVRDAETGELYLEERFVRFVAGSGDSGFGFDFERRLVGMKIGEETAFRLEAPVEAGPIVEHPAEFARHPLVLELARPEFESRLGEAVVGQFYDTEGVATYDLTVEEVTETTVSIRWHIPPGERFEVPALGGSIRTEVDSAADELVQTLEPTIGASIVVPEPSPLAQEFPLALAPGSYVILEPTDDGATLRLQFAATPYPTIIGRDLDFDVTITTVTGGGALPDDSLAGRTSPQVNGQPEAKADYGPFLAPAEHDDSHDDSSHEHDDSMDDAMDDSGDEHA